MFRILSSLSFMSFRCISLFLYLRIKEGLIPSCYNQLVLLLHFFGQERNIYEL